MVDSIGSRTRVSDPKPVGGVEATLCCVFALKNFQQARYSLRRRGIGDPPIARGLDGELQSMLKRLAFTFALASTCVPAFGQDVRSVSPTGTKVYFIEPRDGAEVAGPLTVKMGLVGMGVAPAGVDKKDTGHHHIFIDDSLSDLKNGIVVDDKHRHFGNGQTETVLTLPPGKHTLQIVLADHNHIPHNPPVASEVITITVK